MDTEMKLKIFKKVISDMEGKLEPFLSERNFYHVHLSGKKLLLQHNIAIPRSPLSSTLFTKYKELTYKMLSQKEHFMPKTVTIYKDSFSKGSALKKLENLHYPVIVKNTDGSNSNGVFPQIETAEKAYKIIKRHIHKYDAMIAQEMVFGKEYRVLILDDKVIGALEMIRPSVIGDGVSSVRKLIKTKQQYTEKSTKFDRKLKETLKDQGVSLRTVLKKGKQVFFKDHSSLAEGGKTRDVTSLVHKEAVKICVDASKTMDKYLVGIDVICEDISQNPTQENFHILEINGRPDIYIHYDPDHGETRNVLKEVLNFLVKLS